MSLGEDCLNAEHKSRQDILARKGPWATLPFDRAAGSVDLDHASDRIDQPAESRPLIKVFLHLLSEPIRLIGFRANLGDEIRAERYKFLSLCG